ncbi:hypothetical protein HYH03_014917 [Edaphochlamys debaryana]|uniref:Disease resistance R13L4/SHOC-2-like LRR domain-containing protein n=1 Tax=Edaphochlamys debaryana TaxID=47281 RepID=A0A835XT74_9CHLO|nr:hypothetical protein HYH03_014917 [Edaphochlamys debaryana]|eukprot:KAG2486470.1 hypothetical protein HYH03_014917 [Edaphochlamys debaryana]
MALPLGVGAGAAVAPRPALGRTAAAPTLPLRSGAGARPDARSRVPMGAGRAPPCPPPAASAYSRSSWRTAILGEQGEGEGEGQAEGGRGAEGGEAGRGGSSPLSSHEGGGEGSAGEGGADSLTAPQLRVKLSLAAGSGRLDLTECGLREVPREVLELTELEELQLSGNQLSCLPEGISRLTALRRLGLAGNGLEALPAGLGALTALEGLWLHGNRLRELPQELGRLSGLKALSLAGNCIQSVPPGALAGLTSLTDLTLAGNRLSALPPGELAPLTALRKLALNGNRLGEGRGRGQGPLELGLGAHSRALQELMLQGNALEEVDPAVFECPSLAELSLADNRLSRLPPRMGGASSLARLHLFGNRLTNLGPTGPGEGLAALRALSALWLEGNPLRGPAAAALVRAAAGGALPALRALGLDRGQLAAAAAEPGPGGLPAPLPACVRVGCVLGSGPGYFKLQYGPGASGGSPEGGVGSSNRVLVVAFGSAPGTPNWGGLLSRVYKAAASEAETCFDVLYVADPSRDWYGGGDPQAHAYYRSRLAAYTAAYPRVLLLGDSMGATAALLFADLATAALAFCPQVDLTAASIRPGRPPSWLEALRGRLLAAVRSSRAPPGRLQVLVGTWQHDLGQANLLPRAGEAGEGEGADREEGEAGAEAAGPAARRTGGGWRQAAGGNGGGPSAAPRPMVGAAVHRSPWAWQQQGADGEGGAGRDGAGNGDGSGSGSDVGGGVVVRVFGVDSHRLAAALDARGQLVALVRGAVLREMGLRAGQVRPANLL